MAHIGACVLALSMWLAPVVQVYAGTLAEAHCRTHEHLAPIAEDSVQDAGHAAHHSGAPTADDEGAHSNGHDEQHTCDCACGLACTPAAALLPALPTPELAAPDNTATAPRLVRPHAIHAVPQRPPVPSE